MYSLNNKLKSNKHNTYTYTNLSCLYDVELKIPINYMMSNDNERKLLTKQLGYLNNNDIVIKHCLLYTSPSPRDRTRSRMPSSA